MIRTRPAGAAPRPSCRARSCATPTPARCRAGVDAEAVLARLRAENPEARWRARGTRDVQPRITRFTDRLASYLTLAGLTALLIGGVGVALAIQNYLAGKTSDDRDAEVPRRARAASCSASICCRSWCWPAPASCSASRSARRRPGCCARSRRTLLPIQVVGRLLPAAAADRRRLRPADRADLRDLAAGARPRGLAGRHVPRADRAAAQPAAGAASWRCSALSIARPRGARAARRRRPPARADLHRRRARSRPCCSPASPC